eukprot:g30113.t1
MKTLRRKLSQVIPLHARPTQSGVESRPKRQRTRKRNPTWKDLCPTHRGAQDKLHSPDQRARTETHTPDPPLWFVHGYPESAVCVRRFDDSLNSAIRITYRISLRSSSLREPRYPSLGVVLHLEIHSCAESNTNKKFCLVSTPRQEEKSKHSARCQEQTCAYASFQF